MNRQSLANYVLWAAYVLALASSLWHLAWAFGTLEFHGQAWAGWPAAVAVDAGLAALAYALQQRKRAKRPTIVLWCGIVAFAGISAFANVLHAVSVSANGEVAVSTFYALDAMALVKAVVLSATLPLLVVYLGEVVSSDDARVIELSDKERQKADRLAERDKTVADMERKVSAIVSEHERQMAEARRQIAELAEKADSVSAIANVLPVSKADFLCMMANGNGDRPKSASELSAKYNIKQRTADRWWADWRKVASQTAQAVGPLGEA